jgi:predicted transcriptional regulator
MTAATRTPSAQVPIALAEDLAREKEKRRLIHEGLDDVDAGRLVSMGDALTWADSLGMETELPVPLT